MQTAKTEMIYVVQGWYHGWEDVDAAVTHKEAKQSLRTYEENESTMFQIIKRRVWKDTQEAYRGPREVQAV